MPVKRVMYLQFRVKETAPNFVKDCAASLCQSFLAVSAPLTSLFNNKCGECRTLNHLVSADSDVKLTPMETISDENAAFTVYQLAYQNNKNKTFALSNDNQLPDCINNISSALKKKLSDATKKYEAIYGDHASMESLVDNLRSKYSFDLMNDKSPQVMMSKFILARPVPAFLSQDTTLDQEEITTIFQELCSSTTAFMASIGYSNAEYYLNNSYVPVVEPNSTIKVQHLNLYKHPKFDVIGLYFGVEIGEQYYYGGYWFHCQIGRHRRPNAPRHVKEMDEWARERITNYVNYVKKEGLDNVVPVFLDTTL